MKNILKAIALSGALALAGCSRNEVPWDEKDVTRVPNSIDVPIAKMDRYEATSDTYYTYDFDNDGKVDMIGRGGFSYYIYPGYEEISGEKYGKGRPGKMSDEMKEAASKVMNAQREFMREYLKYHKVFETNKSELENK